MSSIVLLTVDCLRSDHLGCYGYDRPTSPRIDEFARSATVFENGYANCPGTRWAFQSLHTGVSTSRFRNVGIPDGYRPLAALLDEKGYVAGGFANNGWVSRDYGYDRGFDTYFSVREATRSDSVFVRTGKSVARGLDSSTLTDNVFKPVREFFRRFERNRSDYYREPHTDARTVDEVVQFIRQQEQAGRDYFLWVHFMDAHTPYTHWPGHRTAVSGSADGHTKHPGHDGLVKAGTEPDPLAIDTYDACIREVDRQVGRVLDALGEDASVVLTGDHGEEFGRYGEFHEASLYSSMTNVPIIADLPELEVGIVDQPAQHLDIPATILSTTGIEVPDHWEGQSLSCLDRGPDVPIFFTLNEGEIGVQIQNWKYIGLDGTEELYRLRHGERESLSEECGGDHDEQREHLSGLADDFLSRPILGRGVDDLENVSEDVTRNLEDLGYI